MTHPLLDLTTVAEIEPYLRRTTEVFRVFDQQDSGCVSFGVRAGGRDWFVKTATTGSAAVSLRRAVAVHAVVSHPAIIPLRHTITTGEGPALVYPWVEGEVLYHATTAGGPDRRHPDSAMARFRRLPVPEIGAALALILDAHLAVERAGLVAVDLYDGCVLYDFASRQVRLCDLDEYRPGPFVLDEDRLPGSSRYMAPEEFRRGAAIDLRTTVFNLGRMVRLLLDAGDDEREWRGTPAQLAVVARATRPDPANRYPTVAAFVSSWRSVCAVRSREEVMTAFATAPVIDSDRLRSDIDAAVDQDLFDRDW